MAIAALIVFVVTGGVRPVVFSLVAAAGAIGILALAVARSSGSP